jgi:predicted DNA-binding protein (MmcQ/YjbR family)
MKKRQLERLREICLSFPGAVERETWDLPTFRVREKIFAMSPVDEGRRTLWCKAPPGSQTILVGADPERFFVPPYVGHRGWVGMWLDNRVNWQEVAEIVGRSYRMTAPKRLVAMLDGERIA